MMVNQFEDRGGAPTAACRCSTDPPHLGYRTRAVNNGVADALV